MKILAFAASSSKQSINKQLATYATRIATKISKEVETEILDLNDHEIPLFSVDKEAELGQPEKAKQFLERIAESDALIISFAEHNGNYSAAYKNLFDWCSRITANIYQQKPLIILATSPGSRGGASVLEIATQALPRFGGNIQATLSVPSFTENFDTAKQILSNKELDDQLRSAVKSLLAKT